MYTSILAHFPCLKNSREVFFLKATQFLWDFIYTLEALIWGKWQNQRKTRIYSFDSTQRSELMEFSLTVLLAVFAISFTLLFLSWRIFFSSTAGDWLHWTLKISNWYSSDLEGNPFLIMPGTLQRFLIKFLDTEYCTHWHSSTLVEHSQKRNCVCKFS